MVSRKRRNQLDPGLSKVLIVLYSEIRHDTTEGPMTLYKSLIR